MKTIATKIRTTLFFKPALIKQAKAQAIIEDITLTELAERALLSYLPIETVIKKIETREPVNRQ